MLLCSFTKKKTGRTWRCFSRFLSRHFPPCFDHVLQCIPSGIHCLMYHDRDTFDFSQGHVTKNQQQFVFYLTIFDFCSVNSCYHTITTMMKPLSQKSNWAVNSLTSDWILQDNLFMPLIADQYCWSMLFEIQIVCQ